jgi:hypothetical protein
LKVLGVSIKGAPVSKTAKVVQDARLTRRYREKQKAHPFQDGLFADLMPAIT